ERSHRIAQIAHNGLEARGPAHIAARFLHLLDAAELEARAAQRRLVQHALPLVLLRLALDVEAKLVVELPLDGGTREYCAQAMPDVAHHFREHGVLPVLLRIYKSGTVCSRSCRSARGLLALQMRALMSPGLLVARIVCQRGSAAVPTVSRIS